MKGNQALMGFVIIWLSTALVAFVLKGMAEWKWERHVSEALEVVSDDDDEA